MSVFHLCKKQLKGTKRVKDKDSGKYLEERNIWICIKCKQNPHVILSYLVLVLGKKIIKNWHIVFCGIICDISCDTSEI